ncbi:MAG: germination protein YpeB, partial [Clostridia bacterium]|nr:germination protein YpeB [Clostridia bacterium]
MSKRNAIRIMSLAAALLVVIIGMAIKNQQRNNYYELQLENEYSRAVEELTAGVNNISLLLKKSKYSGGAD